MTSAGRGPVSAGAATVRDDLGDEVPVPRRPRRLVSLVPSTSELLAHLGLADDLVAVTEYCTSPRGAFTHAERVRGTKNPDTRAIVGLAPDLVIANEEENRPLDVRRLRDAGVPVYVTRVRTVADVAASVAALTDVLDRREAGTEIAAEIHRALATGPSARVTAECAVWRDGPGRGEDETWWLVGGDTYAGDLLRTCGLLPALRSSDERYPRVPLDTLAAADPDVVLLPDEPYAFGDDDVAVFEGWRSQARRVDGGELFWWGHRTPAAIRSLGALAEDVAAGLADG